MIESKCPKCGEAENLHFNYDYSKNDMSIEDVLCNECGTFFKLEYENWIQLRKESIDEYNEKLCYCGHTFKCSCADPDITLFNESVKNETIKLNDPNNGWIKRE